ncbi:carbohydrate kinase family protein [Varunaivibrio sulfuroxidans]|uniref:Fructokinase n=1 Tax=Varunaivibrio sulfuroxidans TaxID=1773489 RepID=A0A4R3J9P3_9PROT|nr:carbohydrate kinase [Varunaivibrio sulfuroxidans]TCS62224.1 fructokinase [Varunaivibrio sulfuroxidans]WES30649.1 carbohydrate kinase [Varunaivibrio sulfuroxidans]
MLVCCGEALVDFVGVGAGAERLYRPIPGGAPFNSAIGAARLGIKTAFFGALGADWLGDMVRARLHESAVRMDLLQSRALATPIALVHESGEGAQYVFHGVGPQTPIIDPDRFPERLPDETDALLIGGLATIVDPPAAAIEALADRHARDVIVYFDPNVRPAMVSDRPAFMARMERLCALSAIVKISADDAKWCYPDLTDEAAAEHLASLGGSVVLLTRGGDDARALGPWGWARVRPPQVVVGDTVGAGDTFNAGFITALMRAGVNEARALRRLGVAEVSGMLDFACAAAALCCTRHGAQAPYLDELERFMGRHAAPPKSPVFRTPPP